MYSYAIQNNLLERRDAICNLGITSDKKLSFSNHILDLTVQFQSIIRCPNYLTFIDSLEWTESPLLKLLVYRVDDISTPPKVLTYFTWK